MEENINILTPSNDVSSTLSAPPIDSINNTPNRNNLILVILIAVVVLLVGLVAYLSNENSKLKDTTLNTEQEIPIVETGDELIEPQDTMEETPAVSQGGLQVEPGWISQQFGDSWTISYPIGWTINDGGMIEGAISMSGTYKDNDFAANFYYPIALGYDIPNEVATFEDLPQDIDAWVAKEISLQPVESRNSITVTNTMVDGVEARIVKGLKFEDGSSNKVNAIYIWRSADKNPRIANVVNLEGDFGEADVSSELIYKIAEGLK